MLKPGRWLANEIDWSIKTIGNLDETQSHMNTGTSSSQMLVYKSSYLLFSVTLAAISAGFQSGGPRWGDFTWVVRTESHADVASVSDDLRFVRSQAKVAPAVMRMLWFDVRADLKELKADTVAEAKHAAARFIPGGQ